MSDTNFKDFCKKAKNRFKNGYWVNFNQIKEQKLNEAKINGKNEEEVIKTLSRMAKSEVNKETFGQTSDDEIYKKVVEILNSDEIIFNPISRLIDESYYSTLSESEKQGYVLELGQKFERMRSKYYLEREA